MVKCVLADNITVTTPAGEKHRFPYGSAFLAHFVGFPGRMMPNGKRATRWTFWDNPDAQTAYILDGEHVSIVLLTKETPAEVRAALIDAEEAQTIAFSVME